MSGAKQAIFTALSAQVEQIRAVNDAEQAKKRGYNRCHNLGWLDICHRNLILSRLKPEEARWDPGLLLRMLEGQKQEGLIRAEMQGAGLTLMPTKNQPMIDKKLNLMGECDDILKDKKVYSEPAVLDYKSASAAMFRRIRQCDDVYALISMKQTWCRGYAWQMQGYHHLYNLNYGQLIFKNKDSAELHIIETERDKHFIDSIKTGLTEINIAVEKKAIPEAVWIDECRSCEFCQYDFPTVPDDADKLERIDDPEIIAMVEEHQELKDVAKRWKQLDKDIKALSDSNVRIGNHLLNVSKFNTTTYNVPEEVKIEYKTTVPRTRKTIEPLIKAL